MSRQAEGSGLLACYALALVAVAAFALTLPATRFALRDIGPWTTAFSRASLAGLLALPMLRRGTLGLLRGQPRAVLCTMLGTVAGFPFLVALAMRTVPAAHGALVIALIPIFMTILGRIIGRDHPGPRFWVLSLAAAAMVAGYCLARGGSSGAGDLAGYLLLLGAAVMAAVGYTGGSLLARDVPPLQAQALPLVLALPLTLTGLALSMAFWEPLPPLASSSWLGVVYVGAISQFLGFVPWYRALNGGGFARMSQVQYLQPFMTVFVSAMWLGETVGPGAYLTAAGVVACLALMRRAPVARPALPEPLADAA